MNAEQLNKVNKAYNAMHEALKAWHEYIVETYPANQKAKFKAIDLMIKALALAEGKIE